MATNPTLLLVPIAENGTKNILPETQATPGNGLMSQSTGFPAECSLPLGAGGVAPDRADFNGAFNLLGGVAFYSQKGWIYQWDAGQDYYAGCEVIDSSNGIKYRCIADVAAGSDAPHDDDGTHWQSAITAAFPSSTYIDLTADITTPSTYVPPANGFIKIAGTSSALGGRVGIQSDAGLQSNCQATSANLNVAVSLPVRSGESVSIGWSGGGTVTITSILFIYAVGEV